MPRAIVEAVKNQFDSSFLMLDTLVAVCPEDIWAGYYHEVPFWYQVYHVVYFVDYWFRESYDSSDFRSMIFDENIPPEFEHEVQQGLFISREDIKEYLMRLQVKTTRFFELLDDETMAACPIEGETHFTYADIIMSQIRHIMYNVGYLNGILRSRCAEESDWYAYNEDN
jgi:hypothetical protein